MGNSFGTAEDLSSDRLLLSNGGTDVFFDVMTLAGCALADTPWQRNFTLLFADGHRFSRGFSGFDLAELPWTVQAAQEHDFVKAVVASALSKRGWHLLTYDPPFIAGQLRSYEEMASCFAPVPNPTSQYGDWTRAPAPAEIEPCPDHGIFVGEYGCRLCDTSIQPSESPSSANETCP
jgi:hypothetical protein